LVTWVMAAVNAAASPTSEAEKTSMDWTKRLAEPLTAWP
jgi:hypothetical protein